VGLVSPVTDTITNKSRLKMISCRNKMIVCKNVKNALVAHMGKNGKILIILQFLIKTGLTTG
jgi:hypothetical protein